MDAHERQEWTLGKYEMRELLGRGGFGTVYRAYDTRLDVERAIKVLHPILNSSPEFISRFTREARLVARMDCPYIVPVYDFDQENARYYLVMKFMAGGSLSSLVKDGGALPFAQILTILRDITAALDYAHARQLVHRDVKPANVLFEPDGTARLSDFGFARALTSADGISSISLSGGMIGTPAYMAPELWRNRPATPASDVYALGCMVTEMLTGQMLFTGDSPAEIMTHHVLDGPQFPQHWPDDAPRGLESVLSNSLERKPEDRFRSASDFYAALSGLTLAADEVEKPATEQTPETPPTIEIQPTPQPVEEAQAAAARWRDETLAARKTGDWERVELALTEWLALAPENPEGVAIQVELARRRSQQAEDRRLRQARSDLQQARQSAAVPPEAAAGRTAAAASSKPVEAARTPVEAGMPAPARTTAPSAAPRPAARAAQPPIAVPSPLQRLLQNRKLVAGGAALVVVVILAVIILSGGDSGGRQPPVNATRTPAPNVIGGVEEDRSATEVRATLLAKTQLARTIFTQNAIAVKTQNARAILTENAQSIETQAARKQQTLQAQAARTANAERQSTAQENTSKEVQLYNAMANWNLVTSDSFDSDNQIWYSQIIDDEFGYRKFTVDHGKFVIDAKTPDSRVYYPYSYTEPVADFLVALDMEIIQENAVDRPSYGLIYRNSDAGYYYFSIKEDGLLRSAYWDKQTEEWTNLESWNAPSAVHSSGVNRLTILAQGSTIRIYINNQFFYEIQDAVASPGTISPLLGVSNAGDAATIEFDNFELRVP